MFVFIILWVKAEPSWMSFPLPFSCFGEIASVFFAFHSSYLYNCSRVFIWLKRRLYFNEFKFFTKEAPFWYT